MTQRLPNRRPRVFDVRVRASFQVNGREVYGQIVRLTSTLPVREWTSQHQREAQAAVVKLLRPMLESLTKEHAGVAVVINASGRA